MHQRISRETGKRYTIFGVYRKLGAIRRYTPGQRAEEPRKIVEADFGIDDTDQLAALVEIGDGVSDAQSRKAVPAGGAVALDPGIDLAPGRPACAASPVFLSYTAPPGVTSLPVWTMPPRTDADISALHMVTYRICTFCDYPVNC